MSVISVKMSVCWQGAVRIHEIYANSPAARSGQLRPGDRILRLNDTEVAGFTHEAVVDLLRSAQEKVGELLVWFGRILVMILPRPQGLRKHQKGRGKMSDMI